MDNIRSLAKDINWMDNDSVITFYENHINFFNNYKKYFKTEDSIDIIQMKTHYINSLIWKAHYTKSLEISLHVKDLIKHLKEKKIRNNNR